MVQVANELGLSLERCLVGTGIAPEQIANPSSEIHGVQELDVLRNILRVLDPGSRSR
jgi:hypothetical protein